MDKTKIALAVAVAALTAGQLYLLVDGKPVQVDVLPNEPLAAAVEIKGAAAAVIADAYVQAGAAGDLVCQRGVISNHPDRIYCTDGRTAGFLLPPEVESAVASSAAVRVEGGKVYTAEVAPKSAAAGAK